jgi:hypothetical protein
MSKLARGVKHLVKEMIAPTVFFFATFQLLAFTRALMLRRYGIDATTFVAATIGALVAAKVVVLADMLPLMNRSPGKPLIYNIACKTPIYFALGFAMHYLEELFDFYRKAGHLVAANRMLMEEIIWTRFWTIQIWLMVLLLVYCALDELVRALGRERVRELFFGAGRCRSVATSILPVVAGGKPDEAS